MTEKHHTIAATQMDTIAKNPPRLEFPANLPITERVEEISRAISEHQVIIICGETGSGKTTQIPKICLQLGLGRKAMIGHTQPRRIAARTIAGRIAEELNVQLGREVGYQVRHHDQTSDATCIKLMTDGVLLAEMQQHSSLKQYQVLIIDEAHERSLNIDFILGYLKQLLPKRPDLKVIITSATIDVERLSEHFDQAPIISVSGRSYPVSIRYSPVEEFTNDRVDQNEQALLTAIQTLSAENTGDILVFVHGEGEVHGLSRFLDKQKLPNTDVLPLYSRLNRAAQSHIFKPHSKRHIILATNVAETSLTIPGIAHVIDFGDARISRYSHKSKIQRLPIEKISQAAARQRAGRCGRTREGICIRLYSEEDFLQRAEYTEPEILRTNLATVILQMKSMGLGDIEDFPFLDKPHSKLISDGIRLLTELSALDDHQQLNQTGKQMARMPLDPRLARMLIAANHYHSVAEICVICGFLSIQDPRERPQDATEKADKAHSRFQNSNSDFIGILNLWDFIQQQKEKLSRNKFKKLCKQKFLSYSRITEWHELHSQLTELCRSLKFTVNEQKAEYNNIHCALLYGLLSHIAKKEIDGRSYQGARGNTLYIFPGSSVFETTPAWIMAAELSETSKLYARHVAKIDPKWLLKPAKKLAKYECNEPRWDQKKQSIVAYESVSLYGLPILTDRVISYARHNPVHARELFIQEALVNCKLDSNARFYQHNKLLIDEIRSLEIKTRCFDKLDENAIYEFYNIRLPEKICSLDALDGWRKTIEQDKPDYLLITDSEILQSNYRKEPIEHYPDVITVGNTRLQASYDYNPGHEKDGISISIPLGLIEYLAELDFENRFPAFAHEKIIFMLKKLPKSLRVKFQPMSDFANEVFNHAGSSGLPLVQSLRELLLNKYGQSLPDSVVDQSAFPQHLKLNYQVIDKTGQSVFEGHDLRSIQQELSSANLPAGAMPENSKRDKANITQWDFGDLAVAEEHKIEGSNILLYPAFVDCHDSVSIELFSSKQIAERQMLNGLKRLYFLYLKSEIKYIKKNLGNELSFVKYSRNISTLEVILDQLCLKIIAELFIDDFGVVRKKADFETILENNKQSFVSRFHEFYKLIFCIFEKHYQILLGLEELYLPLRKISLDDIRDQLFALVYDGFIADIHITNLNEYPRYLDSILLRLKKLETALEKDKAKTLMIQKYIEYCHKSGCLFVSEQELRPELIEFRWMIEEYRVSLFTQEIKTRKKVSDKKLNQYIENNKLFPMT